MSSLAESPPTNAAAPAVPFAARGPLSARVIEVLTSGVLDGDIVIELDSLVGAALESASDVVVDDDAQLALFVLYANAYGAFSAFAADLEWDPALLRVRQRLESAFEAAVRASVDVPDAPASLTAASLADALFALTAPQPGPSLARVVEKRATREQILELLTLRSIYTLREADPHSWAIPRLSGPAKAALVEIQSDEYGGGRPDRVHAAMYATAMRGAGLDDTYGAYVDDVPAVILAHQNLMSLLGLNRRLLGAVVGHLTAFEMTSSLPNRRYAEGMRRVGFGPEVTAYFDEHVEADAVHEQIAGRDLAGELGAQHPELVADILFGAAACLVMDDLVGDHVRIAWDEGRSALRSAESSWA